MHIKSIPIKGATSAS